MQRQPASMEIQALKSVVSSGLWWNNECCPSIRRIFGGPQIADMIYEQRTVWFDFEMVTHLYCYSYFDDDRRENVCEEANTFDALLLSEGERIWFFLLDKISKQGFYGITIPITIHWYEQLYKMNFFNKVYACETSLDLHNLLLMLAGDVESNPGPTYKDICKLDHKKKKSSDKIYKDKNMRRMNLELKQNKIRNEDFDYMIHEEKIQGRMQIGELMYGAAQILTGAYMTHKTNKLMNKMDSNIDKISTQLTDTLTQFRNVFDKTQNLIFKGLDMISLIGDIIFGLIQVSFASANKKIYSLGIEIFRILTRHNLDINILDNIKTYTQTTFDKIKGRMQIGLEDMQYLTPVHVCMFLFSILSFIFTGIAPKTTSVEILMKRLGDNSRNVKNIIDFNNATHNGMTFVLNEIKKSLGLRPQDEVEQFIVGIDKWFDEVRAMLYRSDEWKKSDQILRDPEVVMEVENLYKRGMEYSKEIADKKLTRELTMPFHVHMKLLTELMKQVDTSGAFGTKPRTQPVVIWLFGESGVGKSGMSWPLAIDLNNIFIPNENEAKEFSKHIYMRNVEQEFWDNYQGQNVVIYDDFGQRVDSQTTPNEEFMELIRTANIAPYPLHMAHLEDKRKTRFTSKILLLSSNVFAQNVSSLTFPDAFRRRIDLCGRVTNLAEFTKDGYSGKTGETVKRLDKKKVQEHFGEIISTEVYNIDLIHPESGNTIERNLTYEEFLEKAAEKTREAFDSSHKMNEFLEKYAVNRYKQLNDREMRVKGEIQSDDKFLDVADKIPINDLTLEQLIDLAQKQLLVDKDGKFLTEENITTDKFDEYYSLNLVEEFDSWHIKNLYRTCFKKINLVYDKLLRIKKDTWNKLKTWKENTIQWVKDHPFTLASTILGTLITILTVCSFWTRFFSKPKEVNKIAEYTHRNVTIKLYKEQQGIDVRMFNQAGILARLPKLLQSVLFDQTKAIILNKPYPLVLNLIHELGIQVTLYIVDNIINIRGKRMELSEEEVCMLRPVPNSVVEASSSSDPTTMSRCKRIIEASSSADPTTINRQKKMVEASSSAAPTTMERQRRIMEANSSADALTLSKQRAIMECEEKIPADMQMWKDQAAQNLITNKIFSNLYKICKVKNASESTPLLHGLFVRATTMLVPTHLCEFVKDTDIIEIVNSFNTSFTIPWKEIKQIQIVNALGNEKEATLLVFPNYIPQHSDIVKHFSNAEAMNSYKRADICLPLLRYSEKMKRLLMYILGNTEAVAHDIPVIIEDVALNKDYIIRESLSYNAPTINGDCGSPIIVNENQVLRKIAGIHVAGSCDGVGYAESITQKDLERAFTKIPANMQIKLDLDEVVKLHNIELPLNTLIDALDLNLVPSEKFQCVGRITPMYNAGKSDLRHSKVFGCISDIKTKPAKLRNYMEEGKEVNIMRKNLGKAAMDTPFLDPIKLDEATQLVKQKWLQNIRPELKKILTFEEAIVGNNSSEYISPINRSSSPGYPWILKRPSGRKGKQGWFGDDEYIISKEVETAVNLRISNAKLGIRTPTMWVDTLKDERRPIAKVDAGKTRVFSNGPMDYSIAFRQYFLGFVAHLMENRITNEVSIGTNVYSRDWTKTAKYMQEKGKKVFAGDFSTFDGTLNSSMMFKFLDVVNSFYDDGPENALIRQVLFSEVVNSVHICEHLVYYMTHSQPSGNPVTTPLNCFINSVGGRMCFDILARRNYNKLNGKKYSMYDFNKYVNLVSYGDDNIYNISDEISSWFNMNTITEAFSQIGMIYTDETKDLNKIPPPYKTLEEVSYLKRGFVKQNSRWLAPLDLDTILEMPNWCRGGLDIIEGTKVNCENAIMELAMHPRSVYDHWQPIIENAFRKNTNFSLEFKTFEGQNEYWLEEYFL